MSSIARFLFLRARPGRCRSSVDGAPVACTVWRYFRCGDRSLDATSIKKSESPAGRRHVRQPPSEALLLPSEKGATTSDNLAKIMLSHQPHTLLGQTNILNARCEVHGDREARALRSCVACMPVASHEIFPWCGPPLRSSSVRGGENLSDGLSDLIEAVAVAVGVGFFSELRIKRN